MSKTCKAALSLVPAGGSAASVASGATLSEAGTLTLTVTDEAGNASSAEITLTRVDSGAPVITLEITEYNVIAGVKVSIQGSQLFFDDKTAASWKDDFSAECSVALLFKNTAGTEAEVKDGDTLSEAGTLTLTVTDEAGNAASKDITLTAVAIYGLESLQQFSLQVDQETDLLAGLTVAEGLTLTKVEIEQDGIRTEIPAPYRYTPEYPGTVTIFLTLSKSGGGTLTLSCGPLAVKPLDYSPIALETADVINSQYAWYNNLLPEKKVFIYPHILTSYLTWERYKWDNMEYIIQWEVPEYTECENVWEQHEARIKEHADSWYGHIKNMTPFANIKASGWPWEYLEKYISSHPDKIFMISCAADQLWWDTIEQLKTNPNYDILQEILKKENVIISIACWNIKWTRKYIINEKENEKKNEEENCDFNSASVNSDKNNKITVVGYNPYKNNIFWDDHETARPIWFWKWNIVMPFSYLVSRKTSNDLSASSSSGPTAALSSTLWNHLSIIMHNHPWTTLEDANTIMQERYLRGEKFKFKDEDGSIKEGGDWYFFDSEKFFDAEVLHKADILDAFSAAASAASATSTTPSIGLPAYPGLVYIGPGIYFTAGGKEYEMTAANRAALEAATRAGEDITWRYSPARARKYGIPAQAAITIRILDTKAQLVPDLTLTLPLK